MALVKVAISAIWMATLGIACSCIPAGFDLCYRLEPNMVGFIGRPVSTEARSRSNARVTFRIEEGMWGVSQLDSITVDVPSSLMTDKAASWFVLAGRPSYWAKGEQGVYLVDMECCPHGLLLPSDHAWAREFRTNVRERKVARMQLEVQSGWVRLPETIIELRGGGRSWRGISRDWTIPAHLAPGEYDIAIQRPYFGLEETKRRVSILPGACTTLRIAAKPASTISGTFMQSPGLEDQRFRYLLEGAVDLERSPLEMAVVEFRRAWQAWTGWGAPARQRVHYVVDPDEKGRFKIAVLPGRYRLSAMSGDRQEPAPPTPLLPTIYYPGAIDEAKAREIEVRPGSHVKDIEFRLSDFAAKRTVEIFVVREDGSPAIGKTVAYTGRYPSSPYRSTGWAQSVTDARGRVAFEVWQSLDYELHIGWLPKSEDRRIPAGSGPVRRRIVYRTR